jgi:hypothetical protein
MESDVRCCAAGKNTLCCVTMQLLCTLPVPGSWKATKAFQQVADITRISRLLSKHRTECNRRVLFVWYEAAADWWPLNDCMSLPQFVLIKWKLGEKWRNASQEVTKFVYRFLNPVLCKAIGSLSQRVSVLYAWFWGSQNGDYQDRGFLVHDSVPFGRQHRFVRT